MTRTFGTDNAIAWVQIRLRGGLRNLLATTGTYAAVIGLGMIGTIQLLPEAPSQVLSGWTLGIMVLQAAVLLLFAPSRVAGAIRSDLQTGIIESHRLMPMLSGQAVVGYILGASSQAICLAAANVALGCVAAVGAGISAVHWLGANALLMAFAVFLWVVLALAAFHPRNIGGLLIFLPVVLFVGQGGALGLAPGLSILITPMLGSSVFDMSATLGGLSEGYALSIMAQVVVGTLCFVAASRKYRRPDVIGFTPVLGLLLLATWVGLSWVGTMWWEKLRPRYVREDWLTAGGQLGTSVVLAMLLALVPVFAAAEQRVQWVGRRLLDDAALGRPPVADGWIVLAATLITLPLAAGAAAFGAGESPSPLAMPVVAAVVLIHLVTCSYLRRALRYYTAKLNGLLMMFLGVLWVGPLVADLVRQQLGDDLDAPVLTEISCVSPVGTLIAVADGRIGQVTIGVVVQAIIAIAAGALYRSLRPDRGLRPVQS